MWLIKHSEPYNAVTNTPILSAYEAMCRGHEAIIYTELYAHVYGWGSHDRSDATTKEHEELSTYEAANLKNTLKRFRNFQNTNNNDNDAQRGQQNT